MKDVLGIVSCISYIFLASPGLTHEAAYIKQVTRKLDSAEELGIGGSSSSCGLSFSRSLYVAMTVFQASNPHVKGHFKPLCGSHLMMSHCKKQIA